MMERRVRQTAEINDVGAAGDEFMRLEQDIGDAHLRGVDDLGEDLHVVARQIGRRAAATEIGGKIGDLFRSPLEGDAEILG